MRDGWNFKCNVYLHLPELNYPDMSCTIKNFTSADPEIEIIQTIVNGEHDVKYVKTKEGWVCQ